MKSIYNVVFIVTYLFLSIASKAQDPFENETEFLLPKVQIQYENKTLVACQTLDSLNYNNQNYFYLSGIRLFEVEDVKVNRFVNLIGTNDTILTPLDFIRVNDSIILISVVQVIDKSPLIRYDLIDLNNFKVKNTKFFQTGFLAGSRINPNLKSQIIKKSGEYFGIFNLDTRSFPHSNLNNPGEDLPYVFKFNEFSDSIKFLNVGENGNEIQDLTFDENIKAYITADEYRIYELNSDLQIIKIDTFKYFDNFNLAPYYGKMSAIISENRIYTMGIVDSLFSVFLPLKTKERIAVTILDLNNYSKKRFSFFIPELDNRTDIRYRPAFNKSIFKYSGKTFLLFDYYNRFDLFGEQNAIFLKVLDDSMQTTKTLKYEKAGKVLRAISASFNQNKVHILIAEYILNNRSGVSKPSLITIDLDSITSISEYLKEESNFNYYPNPSTGVVYFSTYNDLPIHKIELSNIYGQHIIREVIDNKVDLSDLADGLYMGKIEGNNFHKTCKIIISK